MSASVAAVAAVVVAAFARLVARGHAQESTSSTGNRRRTFRGRSAASLIVWLLLFPLLVLTTLSLVVRPSLADVVLLVTLLPICLPWPLARFVTIPMGAPRLTAALCRLADWTWGVDRAGGAALGAVLAARNGRVADIAVARARVERIDLLGGAGVVAAAFLADHDGDIDGSDRLLQALDCFDRRVVPAAARRLARELQARHLIARGAWPGLAVLPTDGSRFVVFARRCAARLAGVGPADARADEALRFAWMLAPRRSRTRVLLDRALAAPLSTSPPPVVTPPDDGARAALPLPRALSLYVATTTQRPAPTIAQVVALADAWGEALATERPAWTARARALGVVDLDVVARGVEETVVDSLVTLVERLDLSLAAITELPPLFARAVDKVRTGRLDALDIAAAALRHRLQEANADAGGDLAPVFELREWLALRALYDDVARTGADGRALAWQACQSTLCEFGVRLWNRRAEHRLANAVHRWLRDESVVVGDERARETHEFNVRCGP
jgi:hypothetical protein